MDLMRALKYPLNDSGWFLKCLIGGGLLITCIGAPCTVGYMLRAARNAARNEPLPDWGDFGALWVEGFQVGLMQLGYALPGILIMMIGVFAGTGLVSMSDSGGAAAGGSMLLFGSMGLGGVVALVGGVLAAVAYLLLMRDGASLGDAFAIGTIYKLLMSNFGTVVLFMVFALITNMIANFLGNLAFGVGVILTSPYAMMVTSALYGQLATIVLPSVYE